MKSLFNTIQEKLKINSKSKVNLENYNYKDIICQELKSKFNLEDCEYVIDISDKEISIIFDFKDHKKYDSKYITNICRSIYHQLQLYDKNINRPTISEFDGILRQIIYKFI